jgi:hypothetical protein
MIGEVMERSQLGNTIREATLIFLMVLLGYGYFSSERDVNINSRLALVKAVVDENRFEIDSYHNSELYTVDKAFINGHYYSDKAIGASTLGVLAYYPVRWFYAHENIRLTPRLFREWITFLAVSLPTAVLAFFLYILAKQITRSSIRGLMLTLAICLGTALYPYSTAFYGHDLAALFFCLAFLIWYHAKQRERISLPLSFFSAVLLGLMVITEYPTAVLAIPLGFYILFFLYRIGQLKNWKLMGLLFIGFMLPIGLLFFYNNSIFGSPFSLGYSHEVNATFQSAHASNLMGIGWPDPLVFFHQTLHPTFGIFWLSPILWLAPIGWIFMAKESKYRAELILSLTAIIGYILLISGYYMWWGGVSYTPRHLIPILPLFILPLAFLPKKYSIIIFITAIISIFQNMSIAACTTDGLNVYLKSIMVGSHLSGLNGMPLYQVCLPNILAGNLMNNRGLQLLGLKGLTSFTPLLIFEISFIGIFVLIQVFSNNKIKRDAESVNE